MTQMLGKTLVTNIVWMIWGVSFMFLLGQVNIPIEPVSITLQSFGVMLIGLTFERKSAISAVLIYLILGFFGCPILKLDISTIITWKQAKISIKNYMSLADFHYACSDCSWKQYGVCEAALTKHLA